MGWDECVCECASAPCLLESGVVGLGSSCSASVSALAHQSLNLEHEEGGTVLDQSRQSAPEIHVGARLHALRALLLALEQAAAAHVQEGAHQQTATRGQHAHTEAAGYAEGECEVKYINVLPIGI